MLPLVTAGAAQQSGARIHIATVNNLSATFTNIPQGFRSLEIVGVLRGVNANTIEYGLMQFNADTTNNYTYTSVIGNGSSATSNRNTPVTGAHYIGLVPGGNATSGIFAAFRVYIPNYSNSTRGKTALWHCAVDQSGSGTTHVTIGLWNKTEAINSVFVGGANGSATGSSFSLYGIRGIGQ